MISETDKAQLEHLVRQLSYEELVSRARQTTQKLLNTALDRTDEKRNRIFAVSDVLQAEIDRREKIGSLLADLGNH